MSALENVATAAGVATKVAGGVSSLFSGLPLVMLCITGVSLLGGAGGTIWYRMQWKDCQAAGAQALINQQAIDKTDNAKAIGALTNKLNVNEQKYEYGISLLKNIPRNDACLRDERINAVRSELCRKYPQSEACSGQRPAR